MRSWNKLAALAAGLALAGLGGCGDEPAATTTTSPTIAWTFHSQGRFEPCGCTAGMNGGLLRRAALLRQEPAEAVLSIEGGGWSAGPADHQQLRTDAYLAALVGAGVDAAALGRAEVTLGKEILAGRLAAARAAKLPVVCANLVDEGGAAIGEPLVRLTAAGRTWALTGLVPADARGTGLRVTDVIEAASRAADAAGPDPLVVVADLDEEALRALARAVPSIALVVGGDVAAPSPEPVAEGRTRIIHQANHGKAAGWWTWGAERCRFQLLADGLPEDPATRAQLATLQRTIASSKLTADHAIPLAPGDAAYAGPAACAACHPNATAIHAASRHAHAREALTPKGYDQDPDCLRCHVTGLGRPGGWFRKDTRAALAQVGCESCHGPAAAHVADGGRTALTPVSPATCVTCHDAENSPHFDYASYWKRIAHDRR